MLQFVEIEQWNRNATSRSRCQVLDDTGVGITEFSMFSVSASLGVCALIRSLVGYGKLWAYLGRFYMAL